MPSNKTVVKSIYKLELKRTRLKLREDQAPYFKALVSSRDAHRIFRSLIGEEMVEVFMVLYVDAKNRVIGVHEAARGGISVCPVEMGSLLRPGLLCGATGMVLCHNHPSGVATPSREDKMMTERIWKAAKLVGLDVLDHIVVGEESYHSMLDAGTLRMVGG